MRRNLAALLGAAVLGATGVTACGSAAPAPAVSTQAALTIPVTFRGQTVSPQVKKVPVRLGQEVVLDVTADTAGEIHVHSVPEQHVEYGVGRTRHSLGTFTVPGQIEVESHTLDKTIVILQVQ